jgi:hypothetical protein
MKLVSPVLGVSLAGDAPMNFHLLADRSNVTLPLPTLRGPHPRAWTPGQLLGTDVAQASGPTIGRPRPWNLLSPAPGVCRASGTHMNFYLVADGFDMTIALDTQRGPQPRAWTPGQLFGTNIAQASAAVVHGPQP